MPDAWVAEPWYVSLSPTTMRIVDKLECSAHGVLLSAWFGSFCGGTYCLRRAKVGSTPQGCLQESLWGGGVSTSMVVQQRLTGIDWLGSMSRMCWMLLHGTYYGRLKYRRHPGCRALGQNALSRPGEYCEIGPPIPLCLPRLSDHCYRHPRH